MKACSRDFQLGIVTATDVVNCHGCGRVASFLGLVALSGVCFLVVVWVVVVVGVRFPFGLGVDQTTTAKENPMVKRDACFSFGDAARLVGRLIDAVYLPSRLTDVELAGLLDSFNELLRAHPEFHALDPRVFGFHQSLIVEHERRTEFGPAGYMAGQLEFGDVAPGDFDVEVAY